MALTQEDLLAIRALMREETAPINKRLDGLEQGQQAMQNEMNRRFDAMQDDIDQIKEDVSDIKVSLREAWKDINILEKRI